MFLREIKKAELEINNSYITDSIFESDLNCDFFDKHDNDTLRIDQCKVPEYDGEEIKRLRFSDQIKLSAVELSKRYGIRIVSEQTKISNKCISRWIKTGVAMGRRKKVKVCNPEIEKTLIEWVARYVAEFQEIPKRGEIIKQARKYVTPTFSASPGWCDKFLQRNSSEFIKLLNGQSM